MLRRQEDAGPSEKVTDGKRNSFYKYCCVPNCLNTTYASPDKIFVRVPQDAKVRKQWMLAARSSDTSLYKRYFCEDHFNLQEDMENYYYFKEMGGRMIMKKDVVPRFFACQPDRTYAQPTKKRAAVTKLQHIRTMKEVLTAEPAPSNVSNPSIQLPEAASNIEPEEEEPQSNQIEEDSITKLDKAIQVKPKFRSVGISCHLNPPAGINVATSPMKINSRTVSTSPIKKFQRLKICEKPNIPMLSSSDSLTTSESFVPAITSSDTDNVITEFEAIKDKVFIEKTALIIQQEPQLFIGVPKNCSYVVNVLSKKLSIPEKHILLTLRKVRLNEAYAILGYDFGFSTSQVSRIIAKTIPNLACLLGQLVFWPSKESIQRNLPLQFRARFANVQSIIDCFEIEIEKPTDAVKQALTWSDYKKCNTLKYLISATPDGTINYISKGYGGRVSDVVLVEDCGYLDVLPSGTSVLADRGFKHLETLLKNQNCVLVRPPSVESTRKSTREEVMLTKRIASVRIHIERVIRRIREYKYLEPHATIDNHLIKYTDNVVQIAAGLINLQGPLIK